MPPVAPVPNQEHAEKRTTLKRLMKELNIRFHLIDDVRPSSLRREFEAVRTIGNATYEENVQRSSSVTLERTKKILRAVRWCLEREQNEEGWRQEVEAKILEPLTEYHKCSKCDKRLWRADFEFPVGDGGGKRWDDLRARRLKRDKCDCPSSSLETAHRKDRVFTNQYGKLIRYDPKLACRVPKGLRPDLVVGLSNGPKMTKILDAPARTDPRKRVGAVIKPDIFVKEGTHSDDDNDTLFPFLVLEAKRAKAPDSLEDIERQMALPAYEMLRTQKQLIESSSSVQAHTRLPRVWLVSFKAQIWKLYVGTMERGQNDKDAYNIYNVWSGDVSGKQDALKLVLLLDCIFDWGLDIYRLDIHERLESMMAFDPRLRRENIAPTVSDISEALEMMTMTPHLETPETISEEVMDVIKFNNGWFRDARRVLDSGGGLLITAANIADIFDNFEHPDHAKRFARLLWELLEHRPLVFSSESVLDRIRENWTGERYNRQPVPESETRIYMQLEVYVYLDLNWQPTRRLIFVAITEDSMSELFSRAQPATFTSWEELYGAGARLVSVDRLLEELRDFREELSASETLQEAIRRWHHRLDYSPTGRGELEWESVTMPSCDKAFHEIFSTYQVGKRQPSESFLKIWHSAQPTVIAEPEDRSLLIAGHTDERDWHRVYRRNRPPRLCIFVFEDLDDYHPRQTAKTLRYWQRQAEQQLGCDYTVLRGNYFSGSTHFDDNRSESEYITPWGAVFPRNLRRAMLPSPASLIDRWIENLDGRGTYEDSDDQEYHTDDSDHRGDGFGGLGTESVSLDEDGEEGADTATEDDEADTHSGEDSEGEEASSSSSEDDDSSDDDDW